MDNIVKKSINADDQRINEDLLEKVEAHLEELEGEMLRLTGHHLKGDMKTLKGKMMQQDADVDIKLEEFDKQIKQNVEKARQKVRHDFKHAKSVNHTSHAVA